jgi:hypothetical protein
VYGDERETTTTAGVDEQGRPVLPTRASAELEWYNIEIDDLSDLTSSEIIALTWERGDGINRFVQASPDEIVVALPEVRFPAVVPEGASVVSSQLVFDVETGTLDAAESAAFGIWTDEPYTRPREVSQLAILRVGSVADTEFPGVAASEDSAGLTLEWTDGDYRYELFCRDLVEAALCWEMAGTMEALQEQATYGSDESTFEEGEALGGEARPGADPTAAPSG